MGWTTEWTLDLDKSPYLSVDALDPRWLETTAKGIGEEEGPTDEVVEGVGRSEKGQLQKIDISEEKIRIAEEKIKVSEEKIRISEEKIRIAEEKIKVSEEKIRNSEEKIKISENMSENIGENASESKNENESVTHVKTEKQDSVVGGPKGAQIGAEVANGVVGEGPKVEEVAMGHETVA